MCIWSLVSNSPSGFGIEKPVTVDVRHGLALEGLTTNNRGYFTTESWTKQGG